MDRRNYESDSVAGVLAASPHIYIDLALKPIAKTLWVKKRI